MTPASGHPQEAGALHALADEMDAKAGAADFDPRSNVLPPGAYLATVPIALREYAARLRGLLARVPSHPQEAATPVEALAAEWEGVAQALAELGGPLRSDAAVLRDCARQARERLAPAWDKLERSCRQLDRVIGSWERSMYAAWIDIRRGTSEAAREILSETLDGYEGPQWDGIETGLQWLERTRGDRDA